MDHLLSSNPTFARFSRRLWATIVLLTGVRKREVELGVDKGQSKPAVDSGKVLITFRFAPRRHTSPGSPPTCDPSVRHAGASGARSQKISDRMSANICRDTATATICKMM
jgi:hypothetical protein